MLNFERERHWLWLIWHRVSKDEIGTIIGVIYISPTANIWTVDVRTSVLSTVETRRVLAKVDSLNAEYEGVLRFPDTMQSAKLQKALLQILENGNHESREESLTQIRAQALLDELRETDADLDHLEEALRIRELVDGQISTEDVLTLIRNIRAEEAARRKTYNAEYGECDSLIPDVTDLGALIPKDEDE